MCRRHYSGNSLWISLQYAFWILDRLPLEVHEQITQPDAVMTILATSFQNYQWLQEHFEGYAALKIESFEYGIQESFCVHLS